MNTPFTIVLVDRKAGTRIEIKPANTWKVWNLFEAIESSHDSDVSVEILRNGVLVEWAVLLAAHMGKDDAA